ncbi:MAG TPA: GxxExxY protein [Bacteroidia bacterium]|nr:GxxExxY protein [Bacteroidia bacterium]
MENNEIDTAWIAAESSPTYRDGLLKEETYQIIGICMDVHRTLGHGFLEIVYKDAIEKELQWKNISYEREKKYAIDYKGVILSHSYYADFVVNGNIILEVKAQEAVPESYYSRLINYLAVSKLEIALLVNFAESSLKYKRFIFTPKVIGETNTKSRS